MHVRNECSMHVVQWTLIYTGLVAVTRNSAFVKAADDETPAKCNECCHVMDTCLPAC